jgi:hypothetical protein
VTPHWIGQIIRKKLQLKTEKRHGSYAVAASEGPGIAGGNSAPAAFTL